MNCHKCNEDKDDAIDIDIILCKQDVSVSSRYEGRDTITKTTEEYSDFLPFRLHLCEDCINKRKDQQLKKMWLFVVLALISFILLSVLALINIGNTGHNTLSTPIKILFYTSIALFSLFSLIALSYNMNASKCKKVLLYNHLKKSMESRSLVKGSKEYRKYFSMTSSSKEKEMNGDFREFIGDMKIDAIKSYRKSGLNYCLFPVEYARLKERDKLGY